MGSHLRLLVLLLAALTACDGQNGDTGTGRPDPDAAVPPDAEIPPDAEVPPDAEAPSTLTADVAMLDFGLVEVAHPSVHQVTLRNAGAAAIALDTPTTTSIFAVSTSTCPSSLAPGATCTLDVQMTPSQLGASSGNLTVASSANPVTVHLTGTGARRLSVTVVGVGHVASTTTDVNCSSGTCDALFPGDASFTATADAQHVFTGWSPICDTAASCAIPTTSATAALTATFAPIVRRGRLHLTFVGGGPGEVFVLGTTVSTCTTDCTIEDAEGVPISLQYVTPATFVRWSGDCQEANGEDCTVDLAGDKHVTVTFQLDDRGIALLQQTPGFAGMAFAADGGVLLADSRGVSEVALDGTNLWTTPITGGASNIVTDAAGNIYGTGGANGPRLFKLSDIGDVVWTVGHNNAGFAAVDTQGLNSGVQVNDDGSVIAVAGGTAYDSNGVLRYSLSQLDGVSGLAVAPDGEVVVTTLQGETADERIIRRFDITGAELPSTDPVSGYQMSLAFDAFGNRASLGISFSRAKTSYKSHDGLTVWGEATNNDMSEVGHGLVFDSTGATVGTFEMDATFRGMRIEQRSGADGHVLWALDRAVQFFGLPFVFPTAIAADRHKHVAVSRNDGWIAIYLMP